MVKKPLGIMLSGSFVIFGGSCLAFIALGGIFLFLISFLSPAGKVTYAFILSLIFTPLSFLMIYSGILIINLKEKGRKLMFSAVLPYAVLCVLYLAFQEADRINYMKIIIGLLPLIVILSYLNRGSFRESFD